VKTSPAYGPPWPSITHVPKFVLTCMGVFPSSGFLVCCRFLVGAERPFLVPSLRSGSRSARKGVKGPKC
jgi:hypothetical protein